MRWIALGLVFGSVSCRASHFAHRADEAMARGEHALALASYQAALAGPDRDDADLIARRDAAATVVAQVRIAEAERRFAAGDRLAHHVPWEIVLAHGWGSSAANDRATAALERMVEVRLAEVVELIEARRYEEAVRLADEMRATLPPNHPLHAQASAYVRQLTTRLVERARNAPVGARAARLALAVRYGAPREEAARALAVAQESVNAAWRVTGTASAECAPFAPPAPAADAGPSQVVVEWVLANCAQDVTERQRDEIYTYNRTTEVEVPSEVARFVRASVDPSCEADAKCLRYDALGVCVDAEERPQCETTERVLKVEPTTLIQYRTETATATRVVHERLMSARAMGVMKVTSGHTSTTLPLDVRVERTDLAYWSPHGFRHFSGRTPDVALREVTKRIRALADAAAREALRTSVDRSLGLHEAISDDERESRWVLALLAGGPPPDRAAAYFEKTYGVGVEVLRSALRFAPRPPVLAKPHPIALPRPQITKWENRWMSRAVVTERDDPTTSSERRQGMDLSFFVEGSPLASSSRLAGPRVRLRSEDVRLELMASSANLGADAGGFAIDMGVFLDEMPLDATYTVVGLRYEDTRNERGERTRFFGIPVEVVWPMASWATVSVSVGLNLFLLDAVIDDDPGDPAYVVPVALNATVDLSKRLYLEGRITRFFASDSDEALHAGLELGVRL